MSNRLANPPQGDAQEYFGRPEQQLFNRLDALLMVLKTCKQDTCRNPYGVLFPNGNVSTLEDAMQSKYDTFFANQPKVSFSNCKGANITSSEGPQNAHVYPEGA